MKGPFILGGIALAIVIACAIFLICGFTPAH